MQIFLSYASEHREKADQLALALRERGHEVFLDRDDLKEGVGYNKAIEDEIRQSDLMVFLISPESVAPGRYTLTELGIARRHWRSPSRRLLPVMIEPTDMAQVPTFAKAVNIVKPKGSMVAEVAAAVDKLRGLEYAVMVGLKLAAVGLVAGLMSWLFYEPGGTARWAINLPAELGRLPNPQVGLLFGLPIAFGVWLWGLRRWWAFAIPLIFIAGGYMVTAPIISYYTYSITGEESALTREQKLLPSVVKLDGIVSRGLRTMSEDDRRELQSIRKGIIDADTQFRRAKAGLLVGLGLALSTMISLAIILPAFRSVHRWLWVLTVGAIVSSAVTFSVFSLDPGFSRSSAVTLMTVWLVPFSWMVGYWLARGRTSVSG